MLFYRRRSSSPLGPESLQKIVQKDTEAGSDEDSETENRSRSPAGNGSRLGGSSRNGSSRAGAVGAGAAVLRGDGSALSAAATPQGSLATNGAGLETLDGVSPPGYYDDETFGDGDDDNFSGVDAEGGNMMGMGPLAPSYIDNPQWSFDALGHTSPGRLNDSDDASSNAPAMGSDSVDCLADRMLEDFPEEYIQPRTGSGDDDDDKVTDIHV